MLPPFPHLSARYLFPFSSFLFHMDLQKFKFVLPFIIFTTLAAKIQSIDYKFEACAPQSCGKGPNISYPFRIAHSQQSFCGYPNFEITCNDEKNPVLTISNDDYIINEIFYTSHSFLLTNAAVYDDDPCPKPMHNFSYDRTPFSYSSNHADFFFFYNCKEVAPDDFYPMSCASNETHHSFAGFHWELLEKMNYSLGSCEKSVHLPVDIAEGVCFNGLTKMEYDKILKMGFVLNWTAQNCSDCENSGGRCGFESNEFVCFCRDSPNLKTCNDGKKKWIIIAGVLAGFGGVIFATCIILLIWQCCKRKKHSSSYFFSQSKSYTRSGKELENGSTYLGAHIFSYSELEKATSNFDSTKELGDGGFGTVYYGKLPDGREVAVKRLYENNYKRVEQFMNEVEILSQLRHPNLVSLFGCTSRHCRELLLVYEYIPNGTVADHLHGEKAIPGGLPWNTRMKIAIETASALSYLHATDVIHRDVKTYNILLDNDFSVKVADFGLSRLFPTDVTHVSTAPQGTPGYVDPEYHECYQLTSKSDVYSFGVVLVELISSKPAVDITRHRHEINLATMAINKIQNHALHELVDPHLRFESDYKVRQSIIAVAELAFRCLQSVKDVRPSMLEVVEVLQGIASEICDGKKAEDIDISEDDVLLKSCPPPDSPNSVNMHWISRTTTPNTSG